MATPIPPNDAPLDAYAAAAATGGEVIRASGARARGIYSDSRALGRGSAFVALRGNTDGHEHQAAAIAAGAALVIAERGRAAEGADAVEVDDTLVAWGRLARAHLRAWRRSRAGTDPARVIVITGSAGKTTTKELCAAILSELGPTWATPGNLNNRVGLPAAAFAVERAHRFVVLEAGMSVPLEIERLAAIAEPDVAVITNVGLAHAEGVGGSRADVAREKGALFEAAREACIAPADDDAAMAQLARTGAPRALTFGRRGDYALTSRAGSRLTLERPCELCAAPGARETLEVELALVGEAAAIDLCAALAAAEIAAGHAIAPDVLARAMKRVRQSEGRAAVTSRAGFTVIDDSYNANPSSVRAALETLAELGRGKRTIAVLGEMLELGPESAAEHERVGDALADLGVGLVIGCGGQVERTLARARSRGIEAHAASDSSGAAELARRLVCVGDVVLVKGSRGARTELVVAALLEERSEKDRS